MSKFVAIDFETANKWHENACAVGVVRVENGIVVDKFKSFINPDMEEKYWNPHFTEKCHHITAQMVKDAPFFDVVWRCWFFFRFCNKGGVGLLLDKRWGMS